MDISFLRELVKGINLSFRFQGNKSKDALLKILQRKLDAEKMDIAFKMYLVCYEAEDVAQMIKPKGMSEIVETVETLFGAPEYLHEVTVGSRRCDLVFFFENDVNAVEVKSSLDKISNAPDQLEYYKKWANKVYLAYDVKHRQRVKRLSLIEKGIGLLEFTNGEINNIYDASFQEKYKADLLSLMTYNYLRKIAVTSKVDLKGGKRAIAKRLSQKITLKETKNLFKEFLRTRALI